MIHKIAFDLTQGKTLQIDLYDNMAPRTVHSILKCLPLSTIIHVWGKELYTDPLPVDSDAENSRPSVDLMDVAFWPPGKAICLFFGPTPISKNGMIIPYSPVNVIGKIKETDTGFLKEDLDKKKVTFRLIS